MNTRSRNSSVHPGQVINQLDRDAAEHEKVAYKQACEDAANKEKKLQQSKARLVAKLEESLASKSDPLPPASQPRSCMPMPKTDDSGSAEALSLSLYPFSNVLAAC